MNGEEYASNGQVPRIPLFAYLYASPLIQLGGDGQVVESSTQELEELNVVEECKDLKVVFRDSGRKLRMCQEIASRSSLDRLFLEHSRGPELIHFACHGFLEGFLALEDETGALDRLSTTDLSNMLRLGSRRTKLVFVCACFSESTGHVFVSAGIPHVVAVQRNVKVADSVSKEFACRFYQALLSGSTVAKAFEFAQQCIQLTPNKSQDWRDRQRKKFLLLPVDADHDIKIFDEQVGMHGNAGQLLDETVPAPTNTCFNTTTSKFLGRKMLMQRIIATILGKPKNHMGGKSSLMDDAETVTTNEDEQDNSTSAISSSGKLGQLQSAQIRWLTLYGQQGVGKTLVAIRTCGFLCQRNACKGIYYIPMKRYNGLRNHRALRASLLEMIKTHAPIESGLTEIKSEAELFSTLSKLCRTSQYSGPLILYFDGCDKWAGFGEYGEWDVLQDVIMDLLLHTSPDLKVLCTTTLPFKHTVTELKDAQDPHGNRCREVRILVPPLTHFYAATLLQKLSKRPLTEGEITSGSSMSSFDQLTSEQKTSKLANHPTLVACAGHPLVIEKVAEKLAMKSLDDEGLCQTAKDSAKEFKSLTPEQYRQQMQQRVDSLTESASSHGMIPSQIKALPSQPPSMNGGGTITPPKIWAQQHFEQVWRKLQQHCQQQQGNAEAAWNGIQEDLKRVIVEKFDKSPKITRPFPSDQFDRLKIIFCKGNREDQLSLGSARKRLEMFWKWVQLTFGMLLRFGEYWNEGIIEGLTSKEDVNQRLKQCSPGTFLFRLSESCPGVLALAFVRPNGQVIHSLVRPQRSSSHVHGVEIDHTNGKKPYNTLAEFIEACATLVYLFPNREKSSTLGRVVH